MFSRALFRSSVMAFLACHVEMSRIIATAVLTAKGTWRSPIGWDWFTQIDGTAPSKWSLAKGCRTNLLRMLSYECSYCSDNLTFESTERVRCAWPAWRSPKIASTVENKGFGVL